MPGARGGETNRGRSKRSALGLSRCYLDVNGYLNVSSRKCAPWDKLNAKPVPAAALRSPSTLPQQCAEVIERRFRGAHVAGFTIREGESLRLIEMGFFAGFRENLKPKTCSGPEALNDDLALVPSWRWAMSTSATLLASGFTRGRRTASARQRIIEPILDRPVMLIFRPQVVIPTIG